jgi:transcriptional regulator with XRE-family HTH domain
MSKIAELVGRKIREYRTSKGLSQEELAHRAGLHTAHLGQIERGEKSPTIDSLDKIVAALGITFEELFSFEYAPVEEAKETITDKVVSCLNTMSISEQKDIYKTIKLLMKWKKN